MLFQVNDLSKVLQANDIDIAECTKLNTFLVNTEKWIYKDASIMVKGLAEGL